MLVEGTAAKVVVQKRRRPAITVVLTRDLLRRFSERTRLVHSGRLRML
jgi:hypothetical protein